MTTAMTTATTAEAKAAAVVTTTVASAVVLVIPLVVLVFVAFAPERLHLISSGSYRRGRVHRLDLGGRMTRQNVTCKKSPKSGITSGSLAGLAHPMH
jgi:hypothetical protein